MPSTRSLGFSDRKTIYSHVQQGLIPHMRIESYVRFSKHQVLQWLEERSFEPRSVNGKGANKRIRSGQYPIWAAAASSPSERSRRKESPTGHRGFFIYMLKLFDSVPSRTE